MDIGQNRSSFNILANLIDNSANNLPYEDSIKQILEILSKISGIEYDNTVFGEVMNDWISSLKMAGSGSQSNDLFGNRNWHKY